MLPSDLLEETRVAPDDASFDGETPTPGLPLESAQRPDIDIGMTEADRFRVIAEAEAITAAAAQVMHISVAGLRLIESFEGFSATIYHDSVGVPTIGYGTTAADTFPLPTHVTRAQAEAMLAHHLLTKYEPSVRALGIPLTQHEFDALCSFAYNLGPGIFSGSTIGGRLHARDYRGAANAMLMYDHAGGQVLQGLLNRRKAERALFLEPDPPAPDPHHLSWFPKNTWVINGERIPEQWTVSQWYRLIGDRTHHHRELVTLQNHAILLRKRVWTVSHQGKHADWATAHRGTRWQELLDISRAHL